MNSTFQQRKIEIVVEDVEGAAIAAEAGADSMELCVNLDEGGLTPPFELMVEVNITVKRINPSTEIHALILHKPHRFYLAPDDIQILKEQIQQAAKAGMDGVVFGALTADDALDLDALGSLLVVAKDVRTTFHRAFDRIPDQAIALEQLIDLGFSRLLTSGRPGKAADHTDVIKRLVAQANGRITIVAGGGIREANLLKVVAETDAPVLHMSCREELPNAQGIKATRREDVRSVVKLCRSLAL